MEDTARLADYVQDIPERYVPGLMQGELVEAEHLCRYLWASALAHGRRVLDAGCGMAYGSALLAEAGASSVVGVDNAAAILETARPRMPAAVELEVADVRRLAFDDVCFDLIVCFEVIEHVEDPEVVLDELARVLAPDGILLVSSPNRNVYPSGNPHHLHEFTPPELEAALRRRFEGVRLVVQHPWTASLITADASVVPDAERLERCSLYRTAGIDSGAEAYSVAIASNAALPAIDDVAVLGGDLEFRRWLELFGAQRVRIDELEFRVAEAQSAAAERVGIRRELLVAEQRLAELPDLRDQIAAAELQARALRRRIEALADELDDAREQADRARQQADRARGVVEDVKGSVSWRVTAPLRGFKQAVRGKSR